ncbi:hypothetical protein [Streptomyces endophytica]|uniref:Uncharacterized protein n=1 Tax=Streptomyces endophytica TaxID=2991496 RepID=A0ABY6PBT0_9ACTN|nr:hypothetical protein [Streptomyces endophytica]UZJ31008.1 hypothetical protein OJ254_12485 [Streptomyces endophytica]
MIRFVTRIRLARLVAEADAARAQAREVQGRADAAYGSHIREVFALTARAEAAEKEAETAVQDAQLLQIALEDTAAELAQARSGPAADASVMLLLHYGEPHSLHPDRAAAYAFAATLGVSLDGWRPVGERPAAEVAWRCVPFIYDATGDHFRSVTAPAVEPPGGAR